MSPTNRYPCRLTRMFCTRPNIRNPADPQTLHVRLAGRICRCWTVYHLLKVFPPHSQEFGVEITISSLAAFRFPSFLSEIPNPAKVHEPSTNTRKMYRFDRPSATYLFHLLTNSSPDSGLSMSPSQIMPWQKTTLMNDYHITSSSTKLFNPGIMPDTNTLLHQMSPPYRRPFPQLQICASAYLLVNL